MNFEDYLRSKKIDAIAFQRTEPNVYEAWRSEYSQMHPNSFTLQKLNLINPVRRKYRLEEPASPTTTEPPKPPATTPVAPKPSPRPMMKPKIN